MDNKNDNVFSKLDNQTEILEGMSSKFEKVDLNDLFNLAKRKWEDGDYKTAQTYFNQVSMLNPQGWEAPFLASLCNFKGMHTVVESITFPEQERKIIINTINRIYQSDGNTEIKEAELQKCFDIIADYLKRANETYFEHKKLFDDTDKDYGKKLKKTINDVYYTVEQMDLKNSGSFMSKLDILGTELTASLIKADSEQNNINNSSTETIQQIDIDKIKEIKLKGKLFFEYNDKVVMKRDFSRRMFVGIVLVIASIVGGVISIFGEWYWVFFFILPFIFGGLNIVKAIFERNRINCSSLLCSNRKRNRLSSDGNVILENKISFIKIISYIMAFSGVAPLVSSIMTFTRRYFLVWSIILMILSLTVIIGTLVNLYLVFATHYSEYNGKFTYYYKNNYYNLD